MLNWLGTMLLSGLITLCGNGLDMGNIAAVEDTSGTDSYVIEHKVDTEVVTNVVKIEPSNEVIKIEGQDTEISMTPVGSFEATAYCPCPICCGKWSSDVENKKTSIGVGAYQGNTVAVDPSVIPYGTKLYIDGVGTFIASDCGGAIKGNRLDIYVVNHSDGLKFGRKKVNVYKINE